MNIAFEQESVYVLAEQDGKKHRFTVKSEWNGLTELRDEIGAILVVVLPRKGGFSDAFGDIFGDIFGGSLVGEKSMTIISGTPGLVEKFKPRAEQVAAPTPKCPTCGGSGFYCGDERAGACSTCKGEINSTKTETL